MTDSATPPIVDSILETIGNTPMVRVRSLAENIRTQVLAKCEFMNPGGSVKDRIGLSIIEEAERQGALKPGGMIVEGTSGNTGVGLALAAAIRGYRCVFTIPDKMSMEKIKLVKAFGADVIVTPTVGPEHPEYYVTVAKRIAEESENAILANQFYNQANPLAHYHTTGPEIWKQTEGRITAFVAGAGTGGTITGVGRYLKEKNPDIRIICADPIGSILKDAKEKGEYGDGQPYKVEGIGSDKIPGTLDLNVIDEVRQVGDKEAFQLTRRMCREEALFAGGSSGLAMSVALDVAREIDDPSGIVVVVLASTGERYLSKVHSDEWMQENRFLKPGDFRAREVITKKAASERLISVSGDRTVQQALALMHDHNVTQLPVIDAGECVGSVREGALMAKSIENQAALERTVRSSMEAPYPVVHADDPMDHVVRLFTKVNEAVLVRSAGKIDGIITRYDVIKHLSRR